MTQVEEVALADLPRKLNDLRAKEGADSLLGALMTTKGVLVVIFSARYNKDIPLVVLSTDTNKVLSKIMEVSAESKR